MARRGHFPTTWFFNCTCARCFSPTILLNNYSPHQLFSLPTIFLINMYSTNPPHSRCCSPTELDTHLSSLLCPRCHFSVSEKELCHISDSEQGSFIPSNNSTSPLPEGSEMENQPCECAPIIEGGLLTPSFPTEYNSPWTCNSCFYTLSSCQVRFLPTG